MKPYIAAFAFLFGISMLAIFAGIKIAGPSFALGFIACGVLFQVSHRLTYGVWYSDDNMVIVQEDKTIIVGPKQRP